ncbi:unnamed protein product [Parnassius mnemosyne]|uniref:Integrase catalytic domain-containing protein n=1 Tax=Parnassius mnemosyne TaxID=213953 RepID=A0AAV1KN99_9NEOP
MEFIKLQTEIINQLNKAKINYKKSPKERLTARNIETRIKLAEEKWTEFSSNHSAIIKSKQDVSASDYIKNDHFQETEMFYIDFIAEMKEKFDQLLEQPRIVYDKHIMSSSNVKLPKISIPTFSGQYSEWMSFRDLFVSLIHKSSMEDVQKLHYLKGYLTGEAEKLLRHIPITNENYEQCWKILQDRYDNKQFLANCILKKFFSQRNVTTESATAIKELLDNTTDTLNGLKSIGINTDSWDLIIIYIVCSKLDQETHKQWESRVSETVSRSKELPSFSQFKEFLENKYHSLEFLDSKGTIKKLSNHSNVCNIKNSNALVNLHINPSPCVYCNGDHRISNCKRFSGLQCFDKRNFVQQNKLCFNCLGNNHSVKQCRITTSCQICRRRHHSLLHPKNVISINGNNDSDVSRGKESVKTGQPTRTALQPETLEESHQNIASHFLKEPIHHVLLATALVNVKYRNDYQTMRALIDQGSQASFITESAVQLLGLKKTKTNVMVSGLGAEKSLVSKSTVDLTIHSRYDTNSCLHVTAYVLEKLTSYLPSTNVDLLHWPELKQLNLADPSFHKPNKIDILLGAEVYALIIMEGLLKYPSGSTVAQNTSLGWILSGQLHSNTPYCNVVSLHGEVHLDSLIRSFWELEAEPNLSKTILTEEEQNCEQLYESTTVRDNDGRYIVRLPFRNEHPLCLEGKSKQIALRRFASLEKRLQKNSDMNVEFKKIFDEYLHLNHMEIVPKEELDLPAIYLPYHAVIKEDRETTKVRIVFDASCKGVNGKSLNDDLMVGPKLQSNLRHIIMRWRTHPVCFIADVVKMYRQVKVNQRDTDFQRILWRENSEQELKEYRLLRLTFGTSSAPYLAIKSLIQLAIDEGQNIPLAAEIVKRDFYVDDLMSGCQNEKEATKLYYQINKLLNKGGFELQKWSSNNDTFLNTIRNEKKENSDHKILELKEDPVNKILGLTWNRKNDEFEYAVRLPPLSFPVTKRKVISDISRLYDPLGWIQPSIVSAKVFIQKMWLEKLDWDEELPPHFLNYWLTYRDELSKLTEFRLPRWMKCENNNELVELHGFSDASSLAYSAVVYLRVIDSDGQVHVNLVTGKSKVAPNSQLSIPRLELCGALLLTKLLIEVSEVLGISKNHLKAWTDSEIVLAWLSSHPSRWKTYIGNRVAEILQYLDRTHWFHVQSEDNSADCASRGIAPSEIAYHRLWLEGASWLRNKKIDYPFSKFVNTNIEERIVKIHSAAVNTVDDQDAMWYKFSSLMKLLRVVAYCRRFLKKKKDISAYLKTEEIKEALHIMIKKAQIKEFNEEIETLKKGNFIQKKSKLISFNPFLDDKGILRIGGRIYHATVNRDTKHPALIPHDSYLAGVLVREAHIRTLHGGPQVMINYLRSKYWILRDKSLVKNHFRKCVTCIRFSAQNQTQLMGQLPPSRVRPSRAFSCSGVDYAGPINIRVSKGRSNRSYKGYICLFICMATRAIHLEVVSDMSSESFLAAFRRFTARRGHCMELFSDNGTNFVGAARELKQLFNEEKSRNSKIGEWLESHDTKWHFNPPQAPNFGGLWEAGIKSTKYHLERVIGNSTLTYEEMSTLLTQIEACLNSRPMTSITDDKGEYFALTPSHFLVGEPLIPAPDHQYDTSINLLRRWHLCQRMIQDFWKQWSQEYLTHFMHRYKWAHSNPEPKIGDVVLVRETDLPPARWLLGRIVKKHPGVDKVTRVVSLRFKNSIIKRPVSKLIVLPICEDK